MDHNSFLNNISSQLNFDCSVNVENMREFDNTVFRKCNSENCGLCNVLKPDNSFKSTTTHRKYKAIVPENIKLVDCNTSNCIYLITCSVCNLQYVGETVQRVKDRFKNHRKGMNNPEKDNRSTILYKHFNSVLCKKQHIVYTSLRHW